jgi:hypothetical protein
MTKSTSLIAIVVLALIATACGPFSPTGKIERADRIDDRQVRIRGWTGDKDVGVGAVIVRIYVDGKWVASRAANLPRPDVAAAHPDLGPDHGFDVTFDAPTGEGDFCVYAIDGGVEPAPNTTLGCSIGNAGAAPTPPAPKPAPPAPNPSVSTRPPFGRVELASLLVDGSVQLRGWVIDPGSGTAPARIRVYADGRWIAGVDADRSRADVGRAYPGYGRDHGLDVRLKADRLGDADQFCVHAVDPDGPLRKIGCIGRPYLPRVATASEAGWLADVLAGQRAGTPGTATESTYRRNGQTHQGIPLVPYGPVSFDRRIVGYVHEILTRYPELHITSGYRDPNRNRAVGGISNSDHLKGRAVDLNIAGVGYYRELQLLEPMRAWVDRTYPGVWADIHGGHLHVSFRQTPPFILPG